VILPFLDVVSEIALGPLLISRLSVLSFRRFIWFVSLVFFFLFSFPFVRGGFAQMIFFFFFFLVQGCNVTMRRV
jgi:hypothetical protein